MLSDAAPRGAAGPHSLSPESLGLVWEAGVLTGIFTEDSACYEDVLLLAEIPLDMVNRAIIPMRAPTKPPLPSATVGTYVTHVPVGAGE